MSVFTGFLPIDKWAHLLVGIVLAQTVTPLSNPIAGFCVALLAGATKEWVIDAWLKMGDFDPKDFYATAGGGVIGAGLALLTAALGKLV